MNNTIYNLTETHKKLTNTLNSIEFKTHDRSIEISWRDVLSVLRQVEKDLQEHSRVLNYYSDYYADSHWTIRTVLKCANSTLAEVRELDEALRVKLQCFLAGDRTITDTDLENRSSALLDKAHAMMKVEKSLLFNMLELLEPGKSQPRNPSAEWQLVGA